MFLTRADLHPVVGDLGVGVHHQAGPRREHGQLGFRGERAAELQQHVGQINAVTSSRMMPASLSGGRRSEFRGAVMVRYTVRLKFGLVP